MSRTVLDGGGVWRARWQTLDLARRRRIARAVGRGRPVTDRRDAALAVGLAARRRRLLPWLLPSLFVLRVLVDVALAPVLRDASPLAPLAEARTWIGALLFALLVGGLMLWLHRGRLASADQANRRLLDRRRRR